MYGEMMLGLPQGRHGWGGRGEVHGWSLRRTEQREVDGGSWWCLLVRGAPLATMDWWPIFPLAALLLLLLLLPMCLSSA